MSNAEKFFLLIEDTGKKHLELFFDVSVGTIEKEYIPKSSEPPPLTARHPNGRFQHIILVEKQSKIEASVPALQLFQL